MCGGGACSAAARTLALLSCQGGPSDSSHGSCRALLRPLRRCLVALSGRDVLVPVREVRMWLEWQTDATIMFHPRLAHAAICLDVAWQRQVGGR